MLLFQFKLLSAYCAMDRFQFPGETVHPLVPGGLFFSRNHEIYQVVSVILQLEQVIPCYRLHGHFILFPSVFDCFFRAIKNRLFPCSILKVVVSGISGGVQRQSVRPRRVDAHDFHHIVNSHSAGWHFQDCLVMNMANDIQPGFFHPPHGFSQ